MAGSPFPRDWLNDDEYEGEDDKIEKLRDVTEEVKDDPDPNYECQTCGNEEYIDEHKKHTPNWCDLCKDVQTFRRID